MLVKPAVSYAKPATKITTKRAVVFNRVASIVDTWPKTAEVVPIRNALSVKTGIFGGLRIARRIYSDYKLIKKHQLKHTYIILFVL